jgi:hypothetical protein
MTPSEIHASIKKNLASVPTETLISLEFFASVLPSMPHYMLNNCSMAQKSIDADTLRWHIQLEMDSRKAGKLPYTFGEMYLKVGIPKEFLE